MPKWEGDVTLGPTWQLAKEKKEVLGLAGKSLLNPSRHELHFFPSSQGPSQSHPGFHMDTSASVISSTASRWSFMLIRCSLFDLPFDSRFLL
jgi:hypothetical protein